MVYKYEYQCKQLTPGERVFCSGFRISGNGHRIILNLPPCECEICCSNDPSLENFFRMRQRTPSAIVPVNPDGSLDWNNSRCIQDGIDISHSMNDAVTAYAQFITDGHIKATKALEAIQKTVNKINSILTPKV